MTSAERQAKLDAAILTLQGRDLDLYLEERALYRALVAEGAHRGVRPPRKPQYYKPPKRTPDPEPVVRAPRLVRSFQASVVERTDGRTVECLVVPWDRPAQVADAPDYQPYQEVWREGAFDAQLSNSGRPKVLVNVEHEAGIRGVVGHALTLRNEPDGLHASLRILESEDGRKTLELVREGVLDGLSLEAIAVTSRTLAGGLVERVAAKLRAVALCRSPAFSDARVLAVRGG